MDDHVAEIDEDPSAVGITLGAGDVEAVLAGSLGDAVGDRARLDLRAARRDDERIGNDRASD